MSNTIWVLRVFRSECKNEDVWYFESEEQANKACAYAIDVIHAESATVEAFDPTPTITSLEAFKADIRMLEGRDDYPQEPELTSVKLGTPDWVKDIIVELAKPFLDDEVVDHIQPCLMFLRDHGASVEAYHSGGGNMHALGIIEKDGLSVLFWTGADAVGANEIRGESRNPSQVWQDIQHEGEDDSSLLAEVVAD